MDINGEHKITSDGGEFDTESRGTEVKKDDHVIGKASIQLPLGQFEDRNDLINMVREFYLTQGYVVSIKKSRKNKIVIIDCNRGGTYRDRSSTPSEDRKRKTVSCLINCPFEVRGKRTIDGYWITKIVNESHNHDPSVDMSGYPSCRQFSEDEILRIREMIKSGVATRQILASLRQSNPKLEAIAKSVHNMKAKIRKEYLGGRTMIQALLEELGKGGFIHNYSHDCNGYLTRLFFAHPYSIALTKSYSNVFVMDCTYKTNKYKMPLLEIVGITSFNTSFCSCFTFLQKEEVDDSVWALRMFSDIVGYSFCPSAIVTD